MLSAQLHLCNIPFIDWENLAGSGPANTVGRTSAALGEHRTGEEQVTTGSALAAATCPNRKLLLNIILAEMNQ